MASLGRTTRRQRTTEPGPPVAQRIIEEVMEDELHQAEQEAEDLAYEIEADAIIDAITDAPMRAPTASTTHSNPSVTITMRIEAAIQSHENIWSEDFTIEELEEWVRKKEALERALPPRTDPVPTTKRRRSDGAEDIAKLQRDALGLLLKQHTPKFSGKTITHLNSWVKEVENVFFLVQNTELIPDRRAVWAMQGLHGDSLTAAQARQREMLAGPLVFTWEVLQQAVRDHLSDPAIRKSQTARALFGAEVRQGQKLLDFEEYMKSLERDFEVEIPEQLRVWLYFVKLPIPIANKLLENEQVLTAPSVSVLMSYARTQESIMKNLHQTGLHRGNHATTSVPRRGGRGNSSASSRGDSQVSDNNSSQGTSSRGSSRGRGRGRPHTGYHNYNNGGRGGRPAVPATAPNNTPVDIRNVQCFNCYKYGHYQGDCPAAAKPT